MAAFFSSGKNERAMSLAAGKAFLFWGAPCKKPMARAKMSRAGKFDTKKCRIPKRMRQGPLTQFTPRPIHRQGAIFLNIAKNPCISPGLSWLVKRFRPLDRGIYRVHYGKAEAVLFQTSHALDRSSCGRCDHIFQLARMLTRF